MWNLGSLLGVVPGQLGEGGVVTVYAVITLGPPLRVVQVLGDGKLLLEEMCTFLSDYPGNVR